MLGIPPELELSVSFRSSRTIPARTRRDQGVAPPSAGALKLQGERIVEAALDGEACKIGSTPARSVITVDAFVADPSVATSITASPFARSVSPAAGIRLIIC